MADLDTKFAHTMELFKVAQVFHPMDVKQSDGKTKTVATHSLPDFLERLAKSRESIGNSEGKDVSKTFKENYMDAAMGYRLVQRKQQEGTLTADDKQNFLDKIERVTAMEKKGPPIVTNSLRDAEEMLNANKQQQKAPQKSAKPGSLADDSLGEVIGDAMRNKIAATGLVLKSAGTVALNAVDASVGVAARGALEQQKNNIGEALGGGLSAAMGSAILATPVEGGVSGNASIPMKPAGLRGK